MSDNDGVKNRIKQYIEYLNIPISAFEKNCGLSNGYVSSIRKGIGHKALEQISEKYSEINKSWLLTGEGKMLKSDESNPKNEAEEKTGLQIMYVPIVGQYAYAGYSSGYDDPGYMDSLPIQPVPIERELMGDYVFFEVKGDSMDNDTGEGIREGDLALSRNIKQEYWKYKLHLNKWNFVIVHKTEGVLIKRIKEHNPETGIITLHSLNPMYEDMEIHINDIAKIFNVVQIVRKMKI